MPHAVSSPENRTKEKALTEKNPTLEKNLECILKYNPSLVRELRELPHLTHDIQLVETNLKEPNLAYDGLPLHSQQGAEKEAKEVFSKAKNTPLSMHVLFGIGLGHLFQIFCQNSKGVVLLYEPNLEILRVTLELVDFSKELSQANVRIYSDMHSFRDGFIASYKYQAQVSFTYLGAYKQIYADSINDTYKQVEKIMGGCIADYNTLKDHSAQSITMVLDNLLYTLEETPLLEYQDLYKDKTALIVSAGPTLDSNIDLIKKNRDKVIIFCVGTAYKALATNGITPDFLNLIEINDCSGQVKDFDLSEVNLILEPYTNSSIHKLDTKTKILFPTNSSHANIYWSKLTDVDISQYHSRGTVSYEALVSAKILGCKKMVLVGQDLAYINNKCYSNSAAYSDLNFEVNPETKMIEFKLKDREDYIKNLLPIGVKTSDQNWENFVDYKIKNLSENLYFVKGITGEMLPTQGGYASFIEQFRDFAYLNPDLDLINTSMVGAQIDGFKNIPLEEAIKEEKSVEKAVFEKTPVYDKNKIIDKLKKEIDVVNTIINEFSMALHYLNKYSMEIKRGNQYVSPATGYFKTIYSIYDKITTEYYKKNPLYQAIAFPETIDIEWFVSSNETIDLEKINIMYNKLNYYFSNIQNKLITLQDKMNEQTAKLRD